MIYFAERVFIMSSGFDSIIRLNQLSPAAGSRREKRRVCRGPGSGLGKTGGRGHNGQRSREGIRAGMEGGQTPLYRILPKRGFTARPNFTEHVSLSMLNQCITSGKITGTVDLETLKKLRLLTRKCKHCRVVASDNINSDTASKTLSKITFADNIYLTGGVKRILNR